MQSLKTAVHEIIKYWNQNVKGNDPDGGQYSVIVKHGNKDYYTNKKDFYTLQISELFFIREDKDGKIGLWRREILRPKGQKHLTRFQLDEKLEEQLYKFFMYECIGNFALTNDALIRTQELAPYDLEKNRLKANPKFKDTVLEVTENGDFYKIGDQFDVFNQLDTGWIVFTECEIGKANNGLAKIEGNKCKVIQSTITAEIDLIEKPKLII